MKVHPSHPLVLLSALQFQLPTLPAATLIADYSGDGPSEGFNDPTLGAARRAAFEYGLSIWSNALNDGYVGEQITVAAKFDPIGGGPSSATLGFAGAASAGFVSGNPLGSNVFFVAPLRNHLSGSDVSSGAEITATFNSDVDGPVVLGSRSFYYGTDNNPSGGDVDFVTVVLHEIAHGLGWSGTLSTADGTYLNGSFISSYDHFVQRTSDSSPLVGLSAADRLAAATGDNISWTGAAGIAANGGNAPHLYAPDPAEPGSSYSHLDEAVFPVELMSPLANPSTGHLISPLTAAILIDQGWSITLIPEPSTALLCLGGFIFMARRRR